MCYWPVPTLTCPNLQIKMSWCVKYFTICQKRDICLFISLVSIHDPLCFLIFFFLILLQNCTWCKDETAVPKRLPPFTKKKYPTSFYKHHTRKNILYPKAFQASILTTVLLPLHGVFTKGKEEWKQAVNHCIGNYKNKKSSKV